MLGKNLFNGTQKQERFSLERTRNLAIDTVEKAHGEGREGIVSLIRPLTHLHACRGDSVSTEAYAIGEYKKAFELFLSNSI